MATTIRVNQNIGTAKILVRITGGGAKDILWSDLSDFVTGGTYANEEGVFHINASPGLLDSKVTEVVASLSQPCLITWGNDDECINLANGHSQFRRLDCQHTGSPNATIAMKIVPDSGCDGMIQLVLEAVGTR